MLDGEEAAQNSTGQAAGVFYPKDSLETRESRGQGREKSDTRMLLVCGCRAPQEPSSANRRGGLPPWNLQWQSEALGLIKILSLDIYGLLSLISIMEPRCGK